MWRRGIMAMIILLSTTCRPANITRVTVSQTVSENLLGTPETSRKGRSTLKALSALTSNWSIFIVDKMVLTTLKWGAVRWWHLPYLYQPYHHNSKVQDVPGIPQVSILVLDKSLGYDLHHALARENKQKSVFNFFLKWRQKSARAVTWECPDQDGVCLVAVLAREGSVDRQADAVPHDGEQDEEIKRLPLHQRYTMLPSDRERNQQIFTHREDWVDTLKGFSKTSSPWTGGPCLEGAWPPPVWQASCPSSEMGHHSTSLLSILQQPCLDWSHLHWAPSSYLQYTHIYHISGSREQ